MSTQNRKKRREKAQKEFKVATSGKSISETAEAKDLQRTVSYSSTAAAKVSLDPRVHYTTAGSSWDRLLDNGPLTDAKIDYYAYRRQGKSHEEALVLSGLKPSRGGGGRETKKRVDNIVDGLLGLLDL
jgi:hypothetical protein